MKKVFIILLFAMTPASGEEKLQFFTSPYTSNLIQTLSVNGPRTIMLHQGPPGNKSAKIDFEGDAVHYYGDLPVDDAAKIFFDSVMRQMKNCEAKQP